MATTLVLATFNEHKVLEMRSILSLPGLSLRALGQFEGAVPPEEDGATLEQNAAKKALYAARLTGFPAMADDTGLEVAALGGAPGVLSARYAGPSCSPSANNAKLLTELAGEKDRSARFVCVIALAFPSGNTKFFTGVLEGRIALAPSGGGGFGYDPLFEIGGGVTLAQLPAERKNALSHRALALAGLIPELRLML